MEDEDDNNPMSKVVIPSQKEVRQLTRCMCVHYILNLSLIKN